ncbi:DNA polymerase III subunit delta [Hazenella sp. IB182353]|uniref:DNA polymerase III subunit delta n=1 Tax=Polycladospora coralii TaxID=2771432 RepID=UPI001746AD50|nr:DNA polymerase III subunit delta [Polycladospora coralii]MBS7530058.1 DNA polymerase III subunit delta [Polycladospora coralii]
MEQKWMTQIKNKQWSPVYIFYGEETFQMEETINWMKHQLGASVDEAFGSVVVIDLQEVSIQSLIQEAETASFLGERRLVIGTYATFLTTTKQKSIDHNLDALIAYLNDPFQQNTVVLTVTTPKLDHRKKAVKVIEKEAITHQFERLQGQSLIRWVEKRLKKYGVHAQQGALIELCTLVGNDLRLLDQECHKIATFMQNQGEVSKETVSALVPRTLEHDVFKLISLIAQQKLEQAFQIWLDLIYQNEEPVKILALIMRQFRLILQVKLLSKRGMNDKEMASQLKVHPYPVKLARQQAQSFTDEALRQLLMQAIEADQGIKTGRLDKHLAVERLLFSLKK